MKMKVELHQTCSSKLKWKFSLRFFLSLNFLFVWIQDKLKGDDTDHIINNDELTENYDLSAHIPVPAPDRTGSIQATGKEDIHEGDLGLGGYKLQLEQPAGQPQMNSLAWTV